MEDQVQKPNNQNVQPVPGTSSVNREREIAGSNYVTPSEPEPRLHEEVEKSGVQVVSDELKLTAEHRAAGIQPPFPNPEVDLKGTVQLPTDSISEAEAQGIIKKGEGSDLDVGKHFEGIYHAPSILGLAVLKLKLLLRTRLFGRAS